MPSRVIRAMRYEPGTRRLEIVFRGGHGRYRYFDVPMEEWQRFRDAPSKGTYLNESFKAKEYRYEKVPASRSDLAIAGKEQVLRSAQSDKGRRLREDQNREDEGESLEWGESGIFPKSDAERYGAEESGREYAAGFDLNHGMESSLRRSVSR